MQWIQQNTTRDTHGTVREVAAKRLVSTTRSTARASEGRNLQGVGERHARDTGGKQEERDREVSRDIEIDTACTSEASQIPHRSYQDTALARWNCTASVRRTKLHEPQGT